jgi:dienelactone hydrolase
VNSKRVIVACLGVLLAGSVTVNALAQSVGTGPYPAIMESDSGLATHTIYRPASLAPFGEDRLLPIVAWGNGGCANAGDAQKNFLAEIASHGMLVIAVGPIVGDRRTAPQVPAQPPGEPPQVAPPTRSAQLSDAIDWAAAENSRSGSRYNGKLDPGSIAIMGYSCGGLQVLEAQAHDDRAKTIALWNSGVGVLPADDRRPGMTIGKDVLETIRVPVAYIAGGPSDIAYPNAVDDVSRIAGVPVFFGNRDVGHGGTYREPNGGAYGAVAADWLKWQLLGDAPAARTFVGADCGLCVDPQWSVEKRNFD